MNSAVYGIRINVFKIGLILCGFVCDFALRIKLDKLVFVALILNQNRIID